MVEFFGMLLDPLMSIFFNRKSIRKDRLEVLFGPMFHDITQVHKDRVQLLTGALREIDTMYTHANGRQIRSTRGSKRRQAKARKDLLVQLCRQVEEDMMQLDAVDIKLGSYKNLRRRRFFKKEEAAFLQAVLNYGPMQSANLNNYVMRGANRQRLFMLKFSLHVPELRDQLRWMLEHHESAYLQICVCYGDLQLAVLR